MTSPLHDKTVAAFATWMQQIGQVKKVKAAKSEPKPKAKPTVQEIRCLATKMGEYNVLRCVCVQGHKGPHNYAVMGKK